MKTDSKAPAAAEVVSDLKPYVSPRLEVHGSVEKLTQKSPVAAGDTGDEVSVDGDLTR